MSHAPNAVILSSVGLSLFVAGQPETKISVYGGSFEASVITNAMNLGVSYTF